MTPWLGFDGQLCPADNKLSALDPICHKEKQGRSEPLGAAGHWAEDPAVGTGQG